MLSVRTWPLRTPEECRTRLDHRPKRSYSGCTCRGRIRTFHCSAHWSWPDGAKSWGDLENRSRFQPTPRRISRVLRTSFTVSSFNETSVIAAFLSESGSEKARLCATESMSVRPCDSVTRDLSRARTYVPICALRLRNDGSFHWPIGTYTSTMRGSNSGWCDGTTP